MVGEAGAAGQPEPVPEPPAPVPEPEPDPCGGARRGARAEPPRNPSRTPRLDGDRPPAEASRAGRGTESLELPRIIAIANQKGGVGKTTTAVNLGAALAESGFRVLVVDLDPQGNASTGLGHQPPQRRTPRSTTSSCTTRRRSDCVEPTSLKNLFVIPATIDLAGAEIELVPAFSRELKLKRALDAVRSEYDFVLIDCPRRSGCSPSTASPRPTT